MNNELKLSLPDGKGEALLSDLIDHAICLIRDAHSEDALAGRHRRDPNRVAECYGRARALRSAVDSLLFRLDDYLPEVQRSRIAEFVRQEGRRRFERLHGGEGEEPWST